MLLRCQGARCHFKNTAIQNPHLGNENTRLLLSSPISSILQVLLRRAMALEFMPHPSELYTSNCRSKVLLYRMKEDVMCIYVGL